MKRINDTAAAFLLTAVIIFLIAFSAQSKEGAMRGYSLCENIIVPSLLPVLILTNIIIKSRSSRVFEFIFAPVFEKLFALPRCTAAAVIFGLVGGYPAGAVLTSSLFRSGAIDEKIASRLLRFNFCGGVAFIITAIGATRYGSAKIGLLLFLSSVLSSLLIAFVSSFFYRGEKQESPAETERLSLSDSLCEATETSVKSILLMSAYIILFSSLMPLFKIPQFLYPILEITNGIFGGEKISLDFCAFFLSFGGFCIHFQLTGIMREIKMKYWDFFLFRVVGALASYLLCKTYLYFYPETADVLSSSSVPVQFSEVSTSLGIIMIIGCAVVIFDIENRKLKLI